MDTVEFIVLLLHFLQCSCSGTLVHVHFFLFELFLLGHMAVIYLPYGFHFSDYLT